MKKSRKRLLISSVAMLLVAMLALGTATFAWFTQSTTARTQNLSVQTTKASTLTISKSDNNWGNIVNYANPSSNPLTLDPASTVEGGKTASNWVNFTAGGDNADVTGAALLSTLKTLTNDSGTNPISGYVFMEQLNIRNEGSAAVTNVKINFQLPESDGFNYIRVALVPTNGVGLDKNDVYGTGKAFKDFIYASNATAYSGAKGVTGSGDTAALDVAEITPKDASSASFSVAVTGSGESLAAANKTDPENPVYDEKYYNLYVWFEGQDPQCVNANAGIQIPDIVFKVTGDTVTS